MAGYHTDSSAHIGLLIGARHGHLDNGGYSIDQQILSKEKISPKKLAKELLNEELWRQILSRLVVCFLREGYAPEICSKALSSEGCDIAKEGLMVIGEKIYREKTFLKFRKDFHWIIIVCLNESLKLLL